MRLNKLLVLFSMLLLPTLFLGQEKKEGIRVNYKDGILIKTSDSTFSMKLNTRLQFLFLYSDRDFLDARERTPSFVLRRVRIEWSGNAFYYWLKYGIQLTMEGTSIAVRDYWVDFTKDPIFQVRAGQFKVPFNREFVTSTAVLQFVDRSLANTEFFLGRDIGVALHGNIGGDKLEYSAGAFNGAAKNRPNQDRALMYVGRATLNLMGKATYAQGDLENSEKPVLAISAAMALLPNFKAAFDGIDDRLVLSTAVRQTGSDTSDVRQVTADVVFKSKGLSFEGEYHYRNINPTETNLSSRTANGWRLQAGYFLAPRKFEVALRFSRVDPNIDADNDARQEITPAFNYFISGHRLKLQADFSFLKQQVQSEDESDYRGRVQLQFYF